MSENELYQKLAARLGYRKSVRMQKIWKLLVSEEEARILLEMPSTPDEIAQKTGLPRETVDRHLDVMYRKGAAIPTKKGWFIPLSVAQLHDGSLSVKGVTKEYCDIWDEFCHEEWFPMRAGIVTRGERARRRVYPAVAALLHSSKILPEEDLRYRIADAETIAVNRCPCRVRGRKCDGPLEVCIQYNSRAKFILDKGTGRKLSREEALQVMELATRHGLVYFQQSGATTTCACDPCCCLAWAPYELHGTVDDSLEAGAYLATVNKGKCVSGCQKCLEICHFKDAVRMEEDSASGRTVAYIDPARCYGCGTCVVACPDKAIGFEPRSAGQKGPGQA